MRFFANSEGVSGARQYASMGQIPEKINGFGKAMPQAVRRA